MQPKTPSLSHVSPVAVLQVLPRLKEGGVEESTRAMVTYLRQPRAGHNWVAHVAAAPGRAPEHAQKAWQNPSAVFHPLPLYSKNPLLWAWLAYKLVGILRDHNIRVVHARSRASAWPARFAAWWCGVPFVTTFHGHYGLRGGWLKRFYNSIMVAGPRVVANSQFTAQHILKYYKISPAKLIVAPRGINPKIFDPALYPESAQNALRESLSIPKGVPLLLLVGRLTGWKGQHVLLEALSLLPHRRFVVAFAGGPEGRGQYAADLQGFAERLGLEQNVRWLGSRPDVPALLAASTLAFSCSTRPEAFGRAAIEAMAMGTPIIATAHGGSLETVIDGKTGWLVSLEPNGEVMPQALAAIVGKALRNRSQLATMRAEARQRVLKHYTEAQMCRTELSAYLAVLKERGIT